MMPAVRISIGAAAPGAGAWVCGSTSTRAKGQSRFAGSRASRRQLKSCAFDTP